MADECAPKKYQRQFPPESAAKTAVADSVLNEGENGFIH
jgi:hypothetical protein